jgi:hypothetical protein
LPAGCLVFKLPFLVLGGSVLAWRPSRRRALRVGLRPAGAWTPGPGDLARRVGGGQPRGRGVMRLAFTAPVAGAAGACGAGDQAACLEDEGGDLLGSGAGDLGQDRGVGVGGEHDGGVAHHVLHHLQFHPSGQGERGGTVAQVMQPDRRQPGGLGEDAEVAGEPVGGQRVAAEAGEDVAAVMVAGLVLAGAVGAQRGDGGVVQGDDAGAVAGLGRAGDHVPVVLLQLLGDDRDTLVEVDVAPAQPGGLAAAQPAQGDQVEGGIEPVFADGVQELGGLRGGPYRDRGPFAGGLPVGDPVPLEYSIAWLICAVTCGREA